MAAIDYTEQDNGLFRDYQRQFLIKVQNNNHI